MYLTTYPITLWPATQPWHHPNGDTYTPNTTSSTLGKMTLLQSLQWWLFYKWLLALILLHNMHMTITSSKDVSLTLGLDIYSQYLDGCHVFKGCPTAMLPLIWYFSSWMLAWCCAWIYAKVARRNQTQNKTKHPSTYLSLQNTCKWIIMNKYILKLQCVPKVCLSLFWLTCCNSRQRLPLLI